MNRLYILRRFSMSSIEEEDESITSDDVIISRKTIAIPMETPLCPSTSEWDSEISESEQEFDEQSMDRTEDEAANRVLKNFLHSSLRNHQVSNNTFNGLSSIHLFEEDKSSDLDVIISELQDLKSEFNDCPSHRYSSLTMKSSSTSGCVYELRTLEDQLEAALASLTLSINETNSNRIPSRDEQTQHSSDSSACSSGVGDEIGNESFNVYPTATMNYQGESIKHRLGPIGDDGDSAFSETESTDKILQGNPTDPLLYRSMAPLTPHRSDGKSILIDPTESFVSPSQHSSRILVRTYNDDGSTKSIFTDDSMSIRDVLFILIHKNHREPHIDYVLMEILPDLHMERIFEDHQKLSEAILMWPTVSTNRLNFTRRAEKYTLFRTVATASEHQQSLDIEGTIYFKEKSRKSWKKHLCVLRSSGLYFIPKGKSKKDLVCLAKFENVELFFGLDWKKKFKSPTDFCFALKHPLIQKKSSKYIKYMCVETKNEFDRWIINIRIAKFGQQLKMNYLLMERAMNIYRASGRFAVLYQNLAESPIEHHQVSLDDHSQMKPPIEYNEMHSLTSNNNDDDRSPIKSASYMDELRQRLERVLNDPPPPPSIMSNYSPSTKGMIRRPMLISSPKLKPVPSSSLHPMDQTRSIKPTISLGSTPLPRKQMQNLGSQSYRTINSSSRPTFLPPTSQMSKSFIIPSKRDEAHNTSSSSITSNSEEMNSSLSKSTLFDNAKNVLKVKPTIINRVKSSSALKKPLTSSDTPPMTNRLISSSSSPASTRSTNKFISSPISAATFSNTKISPITTSKPFPLVPPRKSSISHSHPKSPVASRDSTTIPSDRKAHISHL